MMKILANTLEKIIETARPRLRRVKVLSEIRNNVLLPAIFCKYTKPKIRKAN
jgi:hypothetical protein